MTEKLDIDRIMAGLVKKPNDALMALLTETKEEALRKFDKNKSKYGDSWQEVEPKYLLRRMEEEFYEFRQEVEHNGTVEGAIEELADLNNFALMFLIRAYQEALEGQNEE